MENKNFEKFKAWFKNTPVYFWFVIVMWKSLKQAIPLSELKGRVMELIISLLVGFVSIILLGQVGQIPNIGLNLYTLAVWLVVTVVLRFLVGIFTLPSNLYREMEAEANKHKWVNAPINIPKSFQVNPDGACLVIFNNKKNCKIHKVSIKLLRLIEGNNALLESELENTDVWIPVSRGGSFYPRRSLEPGQSGIYSIAHWNDETAWINRMNNNSALDKILLKNDVSYQITLKFIGEVDGKWMDENIRKYAIRYVNHRIELKDLT